MANGMSRIAGGRPDFYGDPPATRQDRGEAWGWNQAQDRRWDYTRRAGDATEQTYCRHCWLAEPVAGVCPHCGHAAAALTAVLTSEAAR